MHSTDSMGFPHTNLALFVGLAAVWGSSFVAIKAGLEYFPPLLYAALRFELAAIAMFAYAAVRADRWLPRGRTEWLHVVTSGAFVYGAYHAFLFVGQQHVSSAVAAIVVCTAPVLTIGFARLFLANERLAAAGIAGLLVSFIGVFLVARPDPGALLSGGSRGEILILAAAASTALGSVLVQRYPVDLPLETRQAWAMALGAVVLHTMSLARSESLASVEWSPEAIGALAYLVLLPSIAGFLAYFALLDRMGSIQTNLVEYLTPIFAAVVGWLWLGEGLDALTLLGFLVIVLGFALIKQATLRAELPRLRRLLS